MSPWIQGLCFSVLYAYAVAVSDTLLSFLLFLDVCLVAEKGKLLKLYALVAISFVLFLVLCLKGFVCLFVFVFVIGCCYGFWKFWFHLMDFVLLEQIEFVLVLISVCCLFDCAFCGWLTFEVQSYLLFVFFIFFIDYLVCMWLILHVCCVRSLSHAFNFVS